MGTEMKYCSRALSISLLDRWPSLSKSGLAFLLMGEAATARENSSIRLLPTELTARMERPFW